MVAEDSNPEAMGDGLDLHDPEEAEEALSLCDLPLNNDEVEWEDFKKYDRKASSDQDFFEFFSDLSTEICPADDIIFCGKLIPFKKPLPNEAPTNTIKEDQSSNFTKKSFFRWRSESLNDSQSSRSSFAKCRQMWKSRSLDYRKLRRVSRSKNSPAQKPENDCIPSGKSDCSDRRESISLFPGKPRWYLFTFGFGKFPPEMGLKDIRNRQNRRSPSSLFPAFNGGETFSVNKGGGKSSWGLLRALSCNGHANAAVTSSFGCIPHM